MQSDSGPTAKVGIDDELLDLIDLAQLHLAVGATSFVQLLWSIAAPKSADGRSCRRSLLPYG